jgi:hypothetical protein
VPFHSSNAEMLKPKAEQKCTSVFNFDVDYLTTNFDTNKSMRKHSIKCTSRDRSMIELYIYMRYIYIYVCAASSAIYMYIYMILLGSHPQRVDIHVRFV